MKKLLLVFLPIFILSALWQHSMAQATPPELGTAGCFAIFSGNGAVTNAAGSTTIVRGDIGAAVTGPVSGFVPSNVTGTIHGVGDPATLTAKTNLTAASNYLDGLTYTTQLQTAFGNQTLTPGTYHMNATSTLTGTLTLDGGNDTNAVFIIHVIGALTVDPDAAVVLTNGTLAKNVYWKVDGAVTIFHNSVFKGTVISNGAIELQEAVNLEGRILSTTGQVTTNAATVTGDTVCSVPLPVNWLYFRGKAVQQKVLLEWATTTEKNNNYFTIEKSNDAKNFVELAKVKSVVKGNTHNQVYTFVDEQPFASTYYRISQTDLDGSTEWYNDIINIRMDGSQKFEVKHYIQGNTIYIQTTGAASGDGSIELFSMDGRKVASQQIHLSNDNNTYQINQSLSKGIYILVIKSQNEKIYTDKIMIR